MSDLKAQTAEEWLTDFLDSYPLINGVAKPLTKREKVLVDHAFATGRFDFAEKPPTAPAKAEGAAMTPDLIEHARKWAFNYDYALKDALCDLALCGLDAGTRGE